MLKTEHLNKNFGRTEVLKDLNLEVKDGTVFGLVGVNGAGKSTLLRLIAGVYQPDSGLISFNGRNPQEDAEVRRDISFLPDESYYPNGSTIHSMSMLYRNMYGFDEQAYSHYLDVFDLNEKMPLADLSKGNRRRASIVLALSTHPKLLLLDEVYDGLEPLARLRFRQILAGLLEDEDISVIISSHNLRELEDICDSYGILQDGHMKEYGDLLSAKDSISKYQIAFSGQKTKDDFRGLDLLHFETSGRVITLVARGDQEKVREEIRKMNPLLLDVLPVTFEELFLYEIEEKEVDHE